ncbi:hypothetical protein [Micromonospora sp. NPDC049282]|uniref:hypothetical protein n=1 Tax=Micromonospora sp. NPDC049282 TaxID=3364269 RepID=UPI0037222CF6
MTNTGDNSTARLGRTGTVLLAVVAVWLLAALIAWAQWLIDDDRDPDNLALMVAGTALPGLVGIAVALLVTRRTRGRR